MADVYILGATFDGRVICDGFVLWVLQPLFAISDNTVTMRQITTRYGQGAMSLLRHSAFWTTPAFTVLLAFLTALFRDQWGGESVAQAAIHGICGSTILYMFFVTMGDRNAYVINGGIRIAGMLNLLFMGGCIAIYELAYLHTSGMSNLLMWFVTIVTTILVALNQHIVLEFTQPSDHEPKNGSAWAGAIIPVAVVALALGLQTWATVGSPHL